eukprot:COSAG04_NODE_1716_length_5818_cov_7.652387_3_plen_218_part_00
MRRSFSSRTSESSAIDHRHTKRPRGVLVVTRYVDARYVTSVDSDRPLGGTQIAVMRAAVILGLPAFVASHGSLVHPRPRNSIDHLVGVNTQGAPSDRSPPSPTPEPDALCFSRGARPRGSAAALCRVEGAELCRLRGGACVRCRLRQYHGREVRERPGVVLLLAGPLALASARLPVLPGEPLQRSGSRRAALSAARRAIICRAAARPICASPAKSPR